MSHKRKGEREKRSDYVSVSIPRDLAEKVDEIIELKGSGYPNRSQFIQEATRLRVQQMENIFNLDRVKNVEKMLQEVYAPDQDPE